MGNDLEEAQVLHDVPLARIVVLHQMFDEHEELLLLVQISRPCEIKLLEEVEEIALKLQFRLRKVSRLRCTRKV